MNDLILTHITICIMKEQEKKMNCISYLENNIFLNYLHLM